MLEETEERNTEFPTGNLDSFLSEINTPKQNMNISQESIINESEIPDDTAPETTETESDDNVHLDTFTSEAAAEIITGIIDTAFPAALAALAKGKTEDFQAEKEQKKTLQKSFKKYLDSKGLDLPPGWLLLFLVVTIYGVKVPAAITMRKDFKEENERVKIIEEQKRIIEDLKKQISETEQKTVE